MNGSSLNQRSMLVMIVLVVGLIWFAADGGRGGSSRFAVPEIGIPEADVLIKSGAIVIDARGQEQFENRHIPGAILIPLSVLKAGIPALLDHARDKSIVVYCGDGSTIGPEATHVLRQAGYTQAVNLQPGIQGWANAGMPVQQR